MCIADRIMNLRKGKGISQEELADKLGVSRQAISKWETGQSMPDIEKVMLMSDFFEVTTDYLLKGTETNQTTLLKSRDAQVFAIIGSAVNLIGLILAILIWKEKQTPVSVALGLIMMTAGCAVFLLGQILGKNKKAAAINFCLINVWILSLMPISCVFNCIDGIMGGFWWTFTPIPQLGNSYGTYIVCWLVYIALCSLVDGMLFLRSKRERDG